MDEQMRKQIIIDTTKIEIGTENAKGECGLEQWENVLLKEYMFVNEDGTIRSNIDMTGELFQMNTVLDMIL